MIVDEQLDDWKQGAEGPDILYVDNNMRLQEMGTLQSENILLMHLPAYSLDLNPIEHAWDTLGRHVAQRTISSRTVQELKTTLREEWNNIPKNSLIVK
ncbi:hypothetical protein TNCV_125611 [Trichonephila clavipes]|nr:hypothetical protein TNCV_125611 [Trichonephila clavipes]